MTLDLLAQVLFLVGSVSLTAGTAINLARTLGWL